LSVAKFLRELGRPVAYYPRLALAVGSVKATVFLCQLLYWEGKQESAEGWIYKTQPEIEEETGLTRREQESARKILVGLALIEEMRRGDHGKMHFRVNLDALDRLWDEWRKAPNVNGGKRQTSMAESAKGECTDPPNANGASRHTLLYTETTTEITHTQVEPQPAPARDDGQGSVCVAEEDLTEADYYAFARSTESFRAPDAWAATHWDKRDRDKVVREWKEAQKAESVKSRREAPSDNRMSYFEAVAHINSVLSVGAPTNVEELIRSLPVSEETRERLFREFRPQPYRTAAK
jgi:hypothetical protein